MMSILREQAAAFGWRLTSEQDAAFRIYAAELAAWNERASLTAICGDEAVQIKHFLDSLTCLLAFPEGEGQRVIDVGSGAGFPGLPLKIVRPDLRLTLLESVSKKTDFLRHITKRLALSDVLVLTERAEDAARRGEQREQYDVVVARAVAELRVLAEYALPFCRVGGIAIAQKNAGIDDEIANAARALSTLGGVVHNCIPVALPGASPRQLIVIIKIAPTPDRYPRRAGMPEKRPL